MTRRGLVIAAAGSGSGKTTITLGLLRALHRSGVAVSAAKSGPDYIDPAFHTAACGETSVNLDAWAMPAQTLRANAARQSGSVLIVEGAMGVLDGARDGRGSVADLSETLGLPVILVLDIAKQGQSAVLPALGLRAARPDINLAGVILNRAGSPGHADLARKPLEAAGIPVFGTLLRDKSLALPERHLGLVQAEETENLNAFLDRAADRIEAGTDLGAIIASAGPLITAEHTPGLAPLGQRIAVARDAAFAFSYPHLLGDWRDQGAEIGFFSPLSDNPVPQDADAVYLPGGYPELHAGTLAGASCFHTSLRAAAERGALIYGECGGYMTLGEYLTDAQGVRHRMPGLLPHSTSFATRKLTLGYRRLTALPGGPWSGRIAGHEFHYATIESEERSDRLFQATDATGLPLPDMGLRRGSVCGSFAHVISPGPEHHAA